MRATVNEDAHHMVLDGLTIDIEFGHHVLHPEISQVELREIRQATSITLKLREQLEEAGAVVQLTMLIDDKRLKEPLRFRRAHSVCAKVDRGGMATSDNAGVSAKPSLRGTDGAHGFTAPTGSSTRSSRLGQIPSWLPRVLTRHHSMA